MALVLSERTRSLEPVLSRALSRQGLVADPEQRERLLAFVALLERWNTVHNLSAAHGAGDLLQQHVVDCSSIVMPLRRHANGRSLHILDAGTGAGLPAVVLAVMVPSWSITAVDAVGKKVAFLRQVRGELNLSNLRPVHARLESMPSSEAQFDVVTSRAFSSLRQFVEATRHLVAAKGAWAAMKGNPTESELRGLPADCQLFHVERLEVPDLNAERCLVWLRPAEDAAG